MRNIIQQFLILPSCIDYEGVCFELQLINNGKEDARLVYQILYVDRDSVHYESYNKYGCWNSRFGESGGGFLILAEGIHNEKSFVDAIKRFKKFLKANNLIKKA